MNAVKRASVVTHRRPEETGAALEGLCDAAATAGVELLFGPEEVRKHGLEAGGACNVVEHDHAPDVDLCIVLGGDGTILGALRAYALTGVPVFGINFGDVGFLATVDPDDIAEGIRRALEGRFERLELPAIELRWQDGVTRLAMNDISVHRHPGLRVAYLAYEVAGDEVGRVRCDGIVVATPAGSTGYNLANGGPLLAWGVEGFAVSLIAPHSLTARALVVAPGDTIVIRNCSRDEPVDVTTDGRPVGDLAPGDWVAAGFRPRASVLAQVPGASFYHRLREKFGRLAT